MGMFDYARVSGEVFRCSEGHDLTGEEFQTKDLQCIMGTAHIDEDGPFRFEYGGWGPDDFPKNFTGKVEVYACCPECPAFVQAGTLNLCDRSVAFSVSIFVDSVESVKREGGTLAEWIASEQSEAWMAGAMGPIPRDEAYAIHCRHVPVPHQLAESVRRHQAECEARRAAYEVEMGGKS